jgi:hypothetical protein
VPVGSNPDISQKYKWAIYVSKGVANALSSSPKKYSKNIILCTGTVPYCIKSITKLHGGSRIYELRGVFNGNNIKRLQKKFQRLKDKANRERRSTAVHTRQLTAGETLGIWRN